MRLRVLLADDHRLILAAVRRVLASDPEIEVVAEAARGEQVLPLALQTTPDVVLLDVGLPGTDGITCARRLRERLPQTRILMLTANDDADSIEAAAAAGADAYIVKSVASVDFARAIRDAVAGAGFQVVGLADRDTSPGALAGLSERELTVLSGLVRGLTNKQIGRELWVTEQTVKFHLRNIYKKLDAANRTDAVRRASELGVRIPVRGRAAQLVS